MEKKSQDLPLGKFYILVHNPTHGTDRCLMITNKEPKCLLEFEQASHESVEGDGFERLSFGSAGPDEKKMRKLLAEKWYNLPKNAYGSNRIFSRENFSARMIEYLKGF